MLLLSLPNVNCCFLDVILESQARLHKRNLRKREKEHPENKSSKKKQLTGPALVFKLKDDDILSDIQAMRNVKFYYIFKGKKGRNF